MNTKEAVVKAYLETHNRHDLPGALTFFTEDVCFGMVGVWEKVGLEEVRALEAWDSVTHSQLIPSNFTTEGDTVICRMVERSDWYRAAGLDEIRYAACRFTVRQQKIAAIRAELVPESFEKVSETIRAAVTWAAREHPDTLAELMPEDDFVYGAENALRWIELLKAWQED